MMKVCATIFTGLAAAAAAAPAMAQNVNGTPNSGTVTLRTGFQPDPRTVQVQAGGTINANRLGNGCRGFISLRPDIRLVWTGGGSLPLTIRATSGSDTTLVVNGPNGEWACNDDAAPGERNPGVSFSDARSGRYEIWVGTYASGPARPARVTISELNPVGGGGDDAQDGDDSAVRVLNVNTGFQPDPRSEDVAAGGTINAGERFGGNCSGYIARRPDFRIRYTAGSLPLILSTDAAADTTLVVRAPGGRITCDDDSGNGSNARIRFSSPRSGSYDVWVGTFRSGNAQPARLLISEIDRR